MMQRSGHHQDHHDTNPHVLAGRLNTGWLMCERESNPTKRQKLEDHWIHLLHDYEAACDRADPRPEPKAADRFSFTEGLA